MRALALHEFHQQLGARFADVNGCEVVADYGDVLAERGALAQSAGALDLGYRSRVCLLGADRKKFLHGQVTNAVSDLAVGAGCYAALVTAKGRMQADLFIYCLAEELLLDFEPGFTAAVQQRLEKYIIAEDVQVVDVAEPYGHLSVQGPRAGEVIAALGLDWTPPAQPGGIVHRADPRLGDLYLANRPRLGGAGFDVFVPAAALPAVADKLFAAARACDGRPVGWSAMEHARIEAAIPRYGADMDESTLPPEAGLETRAISYTKGCYIGQEVIARIRTYGQVARALRGLRLAADPAGPVARGDKVLWGDKEIGFITSVAALRDGGALALGYLRREHNQRGDAIPVRTSLGLVSGTVATVPFEPFP